MTETIKERIKKKAIRIERTFSSYLEFYAKITQKTQDFISSDHILLHPLMFFYQLHVLLAFVKNSRTILLLLKE